MGKWGVKVMQRMSPTSEAPAPSLGADRQWRLKVRDATGQIRLVTATGVTQAQVVQRAVTQGGQVLSIEPHVAENAVRVQGGRQVFPLLLFSQELLALLDAGLNLSEAMSTLAAKERVSWVRDVLCRVLQGLREGASFSEAMRREPACFPDLYMATVKASEHTGDMPQTLMRYIVYQTQVDVIRKKLISAAIYPSMLLIVGGMVTLFLLGYVVPRFAVVYESSGRNMPWLSMQLLAFGQLIHDHALVAGLLLLSVLASFITALSRPQGRAWLLARLLSFPVLARRAAEFRLSRFYRAVGMLLASGIALPRAMAMVADLLDEAQRVRLAQARMAIEQGHRLSDALLQHGLCTPVAESLIKVGERSGQMADMLERVARFQDDDFARWVDWASKLLEPVLMTVMGLVIGLVVVLMYMPIFDLAGSLQ